MMRSIKHPFVTSWIRYNPRPLDVAAKVDAYFRKYPSKPNDDRYLRALHLARVDYSGPKVYPFHINDSIANFQHTNTSPGCPYRQTGYRRKDEVPAIMIKNAVRRYKEGEWTKCIHPCIAVCKSMVAKVPKCRLVWVYPADMTFAEGMFAQPLIHQLMGERSHYAQWVQYSKGHMSYLQGQLPNSWKWLGLDYSSYDSTVPPWLIRDAFDILCERIDFTRYHGNGIPEPNNLRRLWRVIIKYFIETPIKLPSGKVVVKKGGVPSGSYFTSLVNSVCNCIIMHYLLDGKAYSRSASWQLGDDMLVAVGEAIHMEGIAKVALKVFGVIVNADKSEYGSYVSFLGYRMSPKGKPVANYEKLVAQLCLPDRPDYTIGDFVARARALQLSCFGHGSWQFVCETEAFIVSVGAQDWIPKLRKRSELRSKLEALDLAHYPPLTRVMMQV
uniref:RNA-dependent RNA polymerase n=1 Tax=Soybean thrips partiti-like virus 7 TaxID=2801009 RepID=A0A7T8E823_9VIRU|nr:RNA-dependent RNA polymerase [Soybean thrips partiti-like virus 7]